MVGCGVGSDKPPLNRRDAYRVNNLLEHLEKRRRYGMTRLVLACTVNIQLFRICSHTSISATVVSKYSTQLCDSSTQTPRYLATLLVPVAACNEKYRLFMDFTFESLLNLLMASSSTSGSLLFLPFP